MPGHSASRLAPPREIPCLLPLFGESVVTDHHRPVNDIDVNGGDSAEDEPGGAATVVNSELCGLGKHESDDSRTEDDAGGGEGQNH
jgi:hypothetical protein